MPHETALRRGADKMALISGKRYDFTNGEDVERREKTGQSTPHYHMCIFSPLLLEKEYNGAVDRSHRHGLVDALNGRYSLGDLLCKPNCSTIVVLWHQQDVSLASGSTVVSRSAFVLCNAARV